MVSALLDGAGIDPTVINGGVINAYGSNAKLGEGDWMVVEADESDGTFTKLRATIAIVTNIDPEHMDHYGDMDTLREDADESASAQEAVPKFSLIIFLFVDRGRPPSP